MKTLAGHSSLILTAHYSHLWRYETVPELQRGWGRYVPYYNEERQHQSLD